MQPSLLDLFCSTGTKEAIPDFLKVTGWSPTNPTVNGYVMNNLFAQLFDNLNYLRSKGLSFFQADKPYYATADEKDIVRHKNKIYFAKQNSNTVEPYNVPKTPDTNPEFWGVLLDLDKPVSETFALLAGSSTQLFKVKAGEANDEAVNKGQVSALISQERIIPFPTKTSPSSITIDGTLLTLVDPTAGTDYYINRVEGVYSLGQKGLTTVAGFHYGLVGETEALSGNKTEADMVKIRGINAHSIWTRSFRPICEPEGMVFVGGAWYDIYLLNSEHITNGTSKAGLTIAAGVVDSNARAIPKIPLEFGGDGSVNYGKFTWFQANEIAKSHSKRLISYGEFTTISYGVVEAVSADTTGEEVTVGKVEHYPSFVSKYGIEQATGVQWLWGSDLSALATSPTYQAVTDGRGSIYANASELNAVILGGDRGYGVYSGSRASNWGGYVWNSGWYLGSRFACDHLELA